MALTSRKTFFSFGWLLAACLLGFLGAYTIGLDAGVLHSSGYAGEGIFPFAQSKNLGNKPIDTWLLTAKCSEMVTRHYSWSNSFESHKGDWTEESTFEIVIPSTEAAGAEVKFDGSKPRSITGGLTRSETVSDEEPSKWRRQTTSLSGQVDGQGTRIAVTLGDHPGFTIAVRFQASVSEKESWYDGAQQPPKQGERTNTRHDSVEGSWLVAPSQGGIVRRNADGSYEFHYDVTITKAEAWLGNPATIKRTISVNAILSRQPQTPL